MARKIMGALIDAEGQLVLFGRAGCAHSGGRNVIRAAGCRAQSPKVVFCRIEGTDKR